MSRRKRYQLTLTMLWFALLCQALPVTALQKPTPAAENEKCIFLNEERTRVESAPPLIPESIPAAIRPVYTRFAANAAVSVMEGKLASCKKNERLSSLTRLRGLEAQGGGTLRRSGQK